MRRSESQVAAAAGVAPRDIVLSSQASRYPVIQKNWQELIKPPKLETVSGARPDREATLIAEPP